LDSTQDTTASTPIKAVHHINIEDLKTKPKLRPKDFPTHKAALVHAEERLDSLLKHIEELEEDMVFLDENPSPSEVKGVDNKCLESFLDIQKEALSK